MTLRKQFFRCILAIVVQGFAASGYAQILNPGFDTWTDASPNSWHTNNSAPVLVPVTQTTDAHSNSTAARGDVVTFSTFVIAPFIVSGPDSRGFAVNTRQPALHGWYKFSPAAGDQFAVTVNMLTGDNLVGAGAFTSPDSQGVFTEFAADITYFTSDVPDTCILSVSIINFSGTVNVGSMFIVDDISFGPVTAVDEQPNSVPERYSLLQNYPNPFNPATVIRYSLGVGQSFLTVYPVSLKVYDMLGQTVATLVDESQAPGEHTAQWDATNVPSGMYFYRLQAGSFSDVKKMIYIK